MSIKLAGAEVMAVVLLLAVFWRGSQTPLRIYLKLLE